MIKKLLSKVLPGSGHVVADTKQIVTPDISRVIKMPPAEPQAPTAPPEDSSVPETVNTEELAARAEAAVENLSGQFESWMSTDLDQLIAAWTAAQAPGTGPEAYRAIFMAAHNIRGAAGSYGYPAISRLCGSLCKLLEETHPGENSALINLHIEACRAAFSSSSQSESSQLVADAVCDALEQSVAAKKATGL